MHGIVARGVLVPVARGRSGRARSVAAAGSLALHITLISLLLAPSLRPQAASEIPAPPSLPLIAAVTLIDSTESPRGAPAALIEVSVPDPRVTLTLPLLPPLAVDALQADSFDLAREAQTGAETEELERLQGVYLGQIRGRLSRVLEMAVAESGGASGPCEARVIQNERGEVMDIDLDACAFDAWSKHLLADAIRRASPLPSPPAGLAMGSSLTLDLSRL